MTWTWLLPMTIILPITGAALTLVAGRRPHVQRTISVTVISIQLLVELTLITQVTNGGPMVMHVGGWTAPLGVTLVADELAAFMMVVSTVVSLAVLVYGISQGIADREVGPEVPISIFHPTFLILVTGVSNAFVAGDLFNLFVSFEILLTASFVLLTSGGTRERLRAGAPYIVVSLLSSLIFLSAIAMIYAATGTVNMADLSVKLPQVAPGIVATLQAMLLVAFGVKAAVFPMSAWLPDSYPSAPAPVTAVFAGLLTKVGIYAIIRVQTLLFPPGSYGTLLMIAALLTMLVGILGAVSASGIKRILSFTLVSHIGYMVFGIALSSQLGMSGAIYYVAHHIVVQTTLFLVVGLIERQAGASTMQRLGGLATASPLLAFVVGVPALNLSGIPPLAGLIGKLALLEAGAQNGSVLAWMLIGGGVLTSLLTLYVVVRVWTKAFWRSREDAPEGHLSGAAPSVLLDEPEDIQFVDRDHVGRMPVGMVVPTGALIAVGLTLTVMAGPIFGYAGRAADEVLDRGQYITAVVGGRP